MPAVGASGVESLIRVLLKNETRSLISREVPGHRLLMLSLGQLTNAVYPLASDSIEGASRSVPLIKSYLEGWKLFVLLIIARKFHFRCRSASEKYQSELLAELQRRGAFVQARRALDRERTQAKQAIVEVEKALRQRLASGCCLSGLFCSVTQFILGPIVTWVKSFAFPTLSNRRTWTVR